MINPRIVLLVVGLVATLGALTMVGSLFETNDMGVHLMNGRIAIAMIHNATSVSFNQDEMDLITKLERSL